MKMIRNLFKRHAATALVKQGLKHDVMANRKSITDCLHLLAGAMGESWNRVTREAAAGMALVALNKNSALQESLNDIGWELVLTFLGDHPEYVRHLSSRALGDIDTYQSRRLGCLLARPA